MTVLMLLLLGPFTAAHNDKPLNRIQSNQTQALLLELAVTNDRAQPRQRLMELL
jgi:hypothetical protein